MEAPRCMDLDFLKVALSKVTPKSLFSLRLFSIKSHFSHLCKSERKERGGMETYRASTLYVVQGFSNFLTIQPILKN